jgi:hypothetical protein
MRDSQRAAVVSLGRVRSVESDFLHPAVMASPSKRTQLPPGFRLRMYASAIPAIKAIKTPTTNNSQVIGPPVSGGDSGTTAHLLAKPLLLRLAD